MSLSIDCGTYNLVSCVRDEKKNFSTMREVNAFIKLKLADRFLFNMLKDKGVHIFELNNMAYALGEAAVNIAYTMDNVKLQRPMKDGCLNPQEKEAYEILSYMIHGLIPEPKVDKEILYYSVPAIDVNRKTNADFHQKTLQNIFDAYESEKGYKVSAYPINEGLALIYAELSSKAYTWIGISFGSGMKNICFAVYGVPVFQFALLDSGDWIDEMAAQACGESPSFINVEKTKIDLTVKPTSMIERAIQTQYKIMIEKTISEIKKELEKTDKKVRTNNAIDIVIAGGVSSPKGFDVLFRDIIMDAKLPINIANIVRPEEPLYSVAKGCLIAAENS